MRAERPGEDSPPREPGRAPVRAARFSRAAASGNCCPRQTDRNGELVRAATCVITFGRSFSGGKVRTHRAGPARASCEGGRLEMVEVTVVGGGIVGLATAHAILRQRPGTKLVLLEREERLATHQSGRNSGVLHSGIYYRPGSLKAQMAVSGR